MRIDKTMKFYEKVVFVRRMIQIAAKKERKTKNMFTKTVEKKCEDVDKMREMCETKNR